MLPKRLGGVVDEDLLVYGVKGISVVDASMMPDLPGSYTQQTVYAVAEKASPTPTFYDKPPLTRHAGSGYHQG
jgi:choline dehydrogenase-like flavoprotein